MPSLKKELRHTFRSLIDDRDRLRVQVSRLQEIIHLFESEIDDLKFHGDAAFAKVADTMQVPKHSFELFAETTSDSQWLNDIWLSEPDNAALLGTAEAAWKDNMGNPQNALNVVGKVLKGPLSNSERIKCTLFISAIMLAVGKTEEACASTNDVLSQCGNDFKYKDLSGIAHYLRGRVFLEIKSFRQAYWDFSLAVFTPGYHEKAKHFQKYAEQHMQQQDSQG